MTIDWGHFAPWPALAGGVLIGLAAAVLLLGLGRIAGISGIVGGMVGSLMTSRADGLAAQRGHEAWRWWFLGGLLLSPWLLRPLQAWPDMQMQVGTPWLVVAGLLVGVGTRYGAGCTSGHGVCGVSRGSVRSLVATGCFMLAGFVVVGLLRHGLR